MKPAVVAALALIAGMFAASALGYGSGDGDVFWQRALGETVLRAHALPTTLGAATFSAPDARWVPHEWLFATVLAAANRAGAGALFDLVCAAFATATLGIQALRSGGATPRSRLIMLLLVALALTPPFGVRAQVLGWPFLALVMWALEGGPRRAWLAIPAAAVWFNLHASALAVPVIVGAYAVGSALDARRPHALRDGLLIAGGCAAASLATPFGLALPRFALEWSTNPATAQIMEWLPVAPDKTGILWGVYAIAALLVAGELRGARLTWAQRGCALLLFAATMLHLRNLALFAIVAGPWTARALDALFARRVTVPDPPVRPREWTIAALAATAALGLVVARAVIPRPPDPPAAAAATVIGLGRPVRVACGDFSWCSRFAAEPRIRVLIDGRTDAYPAAVFADYRRLRAGDPLPVVDRWWVDAVLAAGGTPLARGLRAAGWTCVHRADPQVYLRPTRLARRTEKAGGD